MSSQPRRLRLWSIAICATLALSILFTPGASPFIFAGQAAVLQRTIFAVTPAWSEDLAVKRALTDLSDTFTDELLAQVEIRRAAGSSTPGAVQVTVQPASGLLDAALAAELQSMGPEAYAIRPAGSEQSPEVLIAANHPLGAVYGLYRYQELVRLDPAARARPPELIAAPAMTLRLLGDPLDPLYPEPEEALRLGFNAIMVDPWPALALYEGYDPALYDGDRYPRERAWVEARRERTAQRIARAKALHLTVVSTGDVPSLPRAALEKYRDQVGPGTVCIDRPVTAELTVAALREVISTFPGIDVYMTRTGENYELGPLVGAAPGDSQSKCGGGAAVDRAVRLVHDVVAGQYQRTYIHRAWDLGSGGIHGSLARASAFAQNLPKDRFLLSFKHTQTDFWRYNPINPNLTSGAAGMVEFQAAREYEGKGAYPNYLGQLFATGGPEVDKPGGLRQIAVAGVKAIWVWGKGGGWGGPVPHSSLWNDANTYALARLAWDPSADPERLALEFATLRFGQVAAPGMAQVLTQSADANLLALYVGPAARRRGPWAPNNLWVRDDVIRGGEAIAELYRQSRQAGDFERAIGEKQLALRLADGMIVEFERVAPAIDDAATVAEVRASLQYHRALVAVLNSYLDGTFHYYRWLDSQRTDEIARERAIERFYAWEADWAHYLEVTETLPAIASAYRNDGMEETAYNALIDLER